MTDIKKLRRMLHVEHVHRVQLEVGVETLRSLLSKGGDSASLMRRKNLTQILIAIQAGGRQTRQLERRYREAVKYTSASVKALDADDVPELLDIVFDLNLPGFMSWLLEQRPDLDKVIHAARATRQANDNIGYGPDGVLLD